MGPIHVVLAHRDPALTDNLVRSIQRQFCNVATANNLDEIRGSIARVRAPLAIVDLELVDFSQLEELCREFPATAFICTHRLADDAMWSQSLAMGAVDCCLASDVPKILQASDRYVVVKQSQAHSAA
jgi:DNA-binding NtrC family response regulator